MCVDAHLATPAPAAAQDPRRLWHAGVCIPAIAPLGLAPPKIELADTPPIAPSHGHSSDFTLRPFALTPPRALLIGSSTVSPHALPALDAQLTPVIERAPVLITQHMPPTFTTILAEHLARPSDHPAHEAEDGEPVVPGRIYLA